MPEVLWQIESDFKLSQIRKLPFLPNIIEKIRIFVRRVQVMNLLKKVENGATDANDEQSHKFTYYSILEKIS